MPTYVYGVGPVPCIGMVIGEAPGAQEERLGRPFVGPSGQKLEEVLRAAGWEKDDLYVTNIYKHRPPNNRPPTKEEIANHELHLLDEMQRVLPQYVLLLGNTACRQFIRPDYKGMRDHGDWHFRLIEGERRWFLPTFHPSFLLHRRDSSLEELFAADVQKFVDALRGQNPPH
jgi:uracil-DNA glycosylase family 4